MPNFCHLHCHTQYSLLDGASDIGKMMDKAVRDGQKAVALTDHGNMFGAFEFVNAANKRGLKPIVGCEFYLVADRHKKSFLRSKNEEDVRHHQLLLAKNRKGYENLSKLCSLGFIEGQYGKYPRIDKELLAQYSEGLIATSCCIGAEIPQTILHHGAERAEELLKWWLDLFGTDDYYIELQRHRGLENIDGLGISQEDVNQILLGFAKKYNLKVICTNDSHYIEEEDSMPHDILLCVNTNSLLDDEKRFRFPSSDFYFKTQDEMNRLFGDVPQAVDYTQEIYDKIDPLNLVRDVLLPAFPVPAGFDTQDDYLRHLTFEGAKKRYGSINADTEERLNFELNVIKNSGYPGYFLIVQDFTSTARQMGVSVGPGRGSAAGSAVAYCTGITNVDPIKYDLLFERFLNPERVSMPDIDIDFDDRGRDKVIDYVVNKYGRMQVAQIVTYGTMAAKSSLRDVGRVMNVPLGEVDKVAKSLPQQLGTTLADVLETSESDLRSKLNSSDDVDKALKFRALASGHDDISHMIQTARKLEGSVRNTGIHACGVIITPDDITKYVPVTVAKDSDLLVSQFDNSVAESAGLLKMDFLGLRTLTIIDDAVKIIEQVHGVKIDPDAIPLDDEKTYELFQRGDTVAIFQYESTGMQRYMKELKPTTFDDLIAMNALYRPGPLAYIPDFIARKHGRQVIEYDLPAMEEYLKDTYGITVYQEQVMLLSQKLASFTKGEADVLRKAMGKKQKAVLDKMYPKFLEGAEKNGHPKEVCDKIWKDWEAFASYAFNKSHSTCYALLGFQTAYLKANYPSEFMAAVLSNNKSDISGITKLLQECNRMNVPVLGPDINESVSDFTSNKAGQIRFGLSALKGVGEGPVEDILKERHKNGPFQSIYDFVKRLDTKSANKKVLESLVLGGAFDCFENPETGMGHRAQFFAPPSAGKYDSFIEQVLAFGNAWQDRQASAAMSLFGSDSLAFDMQEPELPRCNPWSLIEKLEREKEVTGIYISGHPLDDYKMEMENFISCTLEDLEEKKGQPVKVAGIIVKATHKVSQKGTGWGSFILQDYHGTLELNLFSDDYMKFKGFFEQGNCVFITGNYEARWGREDEFNLKVKEVTLLENAAKNLVNSITVKINVEDLTEALIDQLETLCKQHKGQQQLKMTLLDYQNKTSLNFNSKAKKVKVDNDFVSELKGLGVECVVG
ncbi:MAG: DNA polymerase III subunit alpha [Bacteroidetes bacterium]|nr:DNA polymerase III subunit alpha [Bacteroidota bacterium]